MTFTFTFWWLFCKKIHHLIFISFITDHLSEFKRLPLAEPRIADCSWTQQRVCSSRTAPEAPRQGRICMCPSGAGVGEKERRAAGAGAGAWGVYKETVSSRIKVNCGSCCWTMLLTCTSPLLRGLLSVSRTLISPFVTLNYFIMSQMCPWVIQIFFFYFIIVSRFVLKCPMPMSLYSPITQVSQVNITLLSVFD